MEHRALGRIRTYGGISTTVLQTAPFASSGHKRIEITVEIYLNGDVSSTTVILSGYWDLNPGNLFGKQAH